MTADSRVAIILVSRDGLTLGVYAVTEKGRLRAHTRRAVAVAGGTWRAMRDAVRPLVALARARGARQVTIALRPSLGPSFRRAAEDARRLRCTLLRLSAADELRWLFLGGIRAVAAHDGVIAELEPGGLGLAHFRGRVLVAAARIGLGDPPADSGLALGSRGGALVVSGSLVEDPRGKAAAALKRLQRWVRSDAPVVSPDALAAGLAATQLRAPVPDASPSTRS